MPNKLTDNEIKIHLEWLKTVVDRVDSITNGKELLSTVIDYINRLEAENENLQDAIDERDIEIAQLYKRIDGAYKEFAELVHCHCESIINHEWNKKVAPVSWTDAYEQFDDEVDNLLKELVGDKP